MMRAKCVVQLKDRQRSNYFMLMLGLNDTIHQLVMSNSVHWYGNVLKREDSHVLRRELDFEFEVKEREVGEGMEEVI